MSSKSDLTIVEFIEGLKDNREENNPYQYKKEKFKELKYLVDENGDDINARDGYVRQSKFFYCYVIVGLYISLLCSTEKLSRNLRILM